MQQPNTELPRPPEDPRYQRMVRRAFDIADSSMLELVQAHALKGDEHGNLWGLVDFKGKEVHSLSEADPALIEAVEWLQDRGLAEIIDDKNGECILLKEDS